MIKSQRSKLQLKKLIQQQTLTSQLDHPHSLQSRFSPLQLPNDQYKDMNIKFIDCTFNLEINSKVSQHLQLKLESRVHNNQVDCLLLQSKIKQENKNIFHQFLLQQKQESVKSSQNLQKHQNQYQQQQQQLTLKPLKVHSSIDGIQLSKKQHKQGSLPISDLILSDNMYMKLSSRLNQHQSFSLKQENEHLTNLYLENLKIQKQQNTDLTSLIQTQMKLIETKFFEDNLKQKIIMLESQIQQLKNSHYLNPTTMETDYFSQRTQKSISKTPQHIKLSSPKSIKTPKSLLNRKNILQNKIKNQNQKIKEQKDKSLKIIHKLSQAKSDYQKITDKLNLYSTHLNEKNTKSQKNSKTISPLSQNCKSPSRKSNIRKKYDQFLKNQMNNYHKTLKNHYLVIYQQIETFRAYQMAKIEQLKQEINLLKSQIKFIEVKSVGKLIFGEQKQPINSTRINQLRNKNISPSTKTFQSNFSENIMRTVSPIPSLSLRTPQMYSKSPQTFRNSPQLIKRYTDIYTKSPKVYQKSPYYGNNQYENDTQGSMTPRSIKIKDMNILRKLDDTKSRSSKQSTHKQIMRKKQQKLDEGLNTINNNQIKLNQRNKKIQKGKQNMKIMNAKNNQDKSNKDVVNRRCFLFKNEKNQSQFTSPLLKTGVQLLR